MIRAIDAGPKWGPTRRDITRTTLDQLIAGAVALFGVQLESDDASDLLLAEVVRRYHVEDKLPPGREDQTQVFDLSEVLNTLGIEMAQKIRWEVLESIRDSELCTQYIAAEGLQRLEGDQVYLTQAGISRGVALIDKFVPRPRMEPIRPRDSERDDVIDSAAWTGIKRKTISPRNREIALSAIDKLIDVVQVVELTNAERAQALALLAAARNLTEAPDPPSILIWQIIERVAALAGLLGLCVTLFSGLA